MNSDFCHGKLNMPGINEHETIFYSAFVDALLHVGGDVEEGASGGDLEPEFFAIAFHCRILLNYINIISSYRTCITLKAIKADHWKSRSALIVLLANQLTRCMRSVIRGSANLICIRLL